MFSGLKTYFRVAWACKTPLVFLLDTEYKLISAATLKEIATQIRTRFEYIKDISDCDDAALLFKAAVSVPKLEAYIKLIREKLSTLDFDMKRLALDMLNIKVWIDGQSVEITGTIPVEDAVVVTKSS